jgi:hypothetical protein
MDLVRSVMKWKRSSKLRLLRDRVDERAPKSQVRVTDATTRRTRLRPDDTALL